MNQNPKTKKLGTDQNNLIFVGYKLRQTFLHEQNIF